MRRNPRQITQADEAHKVSVIQSRSKVRLEAKSKIIPIRDCALHARIIRASVMRHHMHAALSQQLEWSATDKATLVLDELNMESRKYDLYVWPGILVGRTMGSSRALKVPLCKPHVPD